MQDRSFLLSENFADYIKDIKSFKELYLKMIEDSDSDENTNEDEALSRLSNYIFQPAVFKQLFTDQYSYEFLVKYCLDNDSTVSNAQKNQVFLLILTGKINLEQLVTNLCKPDSSDETDIMEISDENLDEEFEIRRKTKMISIILEGLAETFPGHDDVFKQPTLQLACKQIQTLRAATPAEKAYTLGATIGLFAAYSTSNKYKDISVHISDFLDRKDGANIAFTCTEAAKQAGNYKNNCKK